MKKAILIVVSIIAALAVLLGVGFVIWKSQGNASNPEFPTGNEDVAARSDDKIELFFAQTLDDALRISEANNLETEGPFYEFGMVSVYGVEYNGVNVKFDFIPYEEENTLYQTRCCYVPFGDTHGDDLANFSYTGSELRGEIDRFFGMLEYAFDVTIGTNFFIMAQDGNLLPNDQDASYDAIVRGEAELDFSLRDQGGFYWNLKTQRTEEGILYLAMINYFDGYMFADNIVHVNACETSV